MVLITVRLLGCFKTAFSFVNAMKSLRPELQHAFLKGAVFAAGASLFFGLTVLVAQSIKNFNSGDLISSTDINANFQISAPEGLIAAFYLSSCPTGWVAADGAAGSGTPDLRGQFIRGLNDFGSAAGTRADGRQDPGGGGRVLGDYQADQLGSHSHTQTVGAVGGTANCIVANTCGITIITPLTTVATGGNETRSKNTSLIFCMRKNS